MSYLNIEGVTKIKQQNITFTGVCVVIIIDNNVQGRNVGCIVHAMTV